MSLAAVCFRLECGSLYSVKTCRTAACCVLTHYFTLLARHHGKILTADSYSISLMLLSQSITAVTVDGNNEALSKKLRKGQ